MSASRLQRLIMWVGVAVLGMASPALAAIVDDDEAVMKRALLGDWTMQTTEQAFGGDTCRFTGNMVIELNTDDELVGVFNIIHYCEDYPDSHAKQSSIITIEGDTITFDSEVLSFETWAPRYAPDDFIMQFSDPNTLVGELHSNASFVPAVFERKIETIA